MDFAKRLQQAEFTVSDEKLEFLKTWQPPLSDPDTQIAQLSPTGIQELLDMGAEWRRRYPHLYEEGNPFNVWANYYKSSPRVRDSARYFLQGFLGPDATDLGTVYALNASDPAAWMNSLAPSDLCKAYKDDEGGPYKEEWETIYVPPIQTRLNAMIKGNFNLTAGDISQIPYLCGFETQITQKRSPFCDIFTEEEILQYEYAQDLRYWYGAGLGTDIEKYQMLPVIDMLVERFMNGPNVVYQLANSTFNAPKIMTSFSNDGQLTQLMAAVGIFDDQAPLSGTTMDPERKFKASILTPMRGTIAFERITCKSSPPVDACGAAFSTKDSYMRILLNDVVYPVVDCASGPGSSCPLAQYQEIVKGKVQEAGSFTKLCNMTDTSLPAQSMATFFMDNTLPWQSEIKP